MNTENKTLNAKLLEEKLKKGWGTIQFSEYLGMSVEEFKDILDKTFDGTVGQNYKRRLKKNDKKIEQQLRRRACAHNKARGENYTDLENDAAEEFETEIQNNVNETASDLEVANSGMPKENTLEELKEEEDFLRKLLISYENDHKEVVASRKKVFDDVCALREKMVKIRNEMEECKNKTQNCVIQFSQISVNIDRINEDKAEAKRQLSEIQEQINKLQRVEILLENNNIKISSAEYDIPVGWKEVRNRWIDDERFETFTLLEISAFA